jgi:hypothetical protein
MTVRKTTASGSCKIVSHHGERYVGQLARQPDTIVTKRLLSAWILTGRRHEP